MYSSASDFFRMCTLRTGTNIRAALGYTPNFLSGFFHDVTGARTRFFSVSVLRTGTNIHPPLRVTHRDKYSGPLHPKLFRANFFTMSWARVARPIFFQCVRVTHQDKYSPPVTHQDKYSPPVTPQKQIFEAITNICFDVDL